MLIYDNFASINLCFCYAKWIVDQQTNVIKIIQRKKKTKNAGDILGKITPICEETNVTNCCYT